MKNKLINILNQCIYNKSIEDYTAIIELINNINDDIVKNLNIVFNDTSIYASMFNSDYRLISVSFTDNNMLLFCLPDNAIKTYVIDNSPEGQNCSYNMQYNDIKDLLSIE